MRRAVRLQVSLWLSCFSCSVMLSMSLQGKLFDSTIADEGTWTLGNDLYLR